MIHNRAFTEKILPLIFLIFLLILSPCSLDQYRHSSLARINIEFQGKVERDTQKKLLKPVGEDESYIPPFVESIRVEVFKSGELVETIESSRGEEGFSTGFPFKYEFGEEYSFSAKVYSCAVDETFSTTCAYPPPNSDDCIPVETHSGEGIIEEIIGGVENIQLTINLATHPMRLFSDYPKDFLQGFSATSLWKDYAVDIDSNGDMLMSLQDSSLENRLWYNVVDLHDRDSVTSVLNIPELVVRATTSNAIRNGMIYMPYIKEQPDLTFTPSLIIKTDDESESSFTDRALGPAELGNFDKNPVIDIDHGFAAVAINNESGRLYVKTFDDEFTVGSDSSIQGICVDSCFDPKLKIIDKDTFIVFYTVEASIEAQTLNRNAEPIENEIYPPVNFIDDLPYYSFSQIPGGQFFLAKSFSFNIYLERLNADLSIDVQYEPVNSLHLVNGLDIQRRPSIAFYNGKNYIAWTNDKLIEEESDASPNFNIFAAPLLLDGNVDSEKIIRVSNFDSTGSFPCHNQAHRDPKILINEDGLGVISWLGASSAVDADVIYYRKLIF